MRQFEAPLHVTVNGSSLTFSNFIYWFPAGEGPDSAGGQPGAYNYWIGMNDDPVYGGMAKEVIANEAANTATIMLEVKEGWHVGTQYYGQPPGLSLLNIDIPFGKQTIRVDAIWLIVIAIGVLLIV